MGLLCDISGLVLWVFYVIFMVCFMSLLCDIYGLLYGSFM